MHIVLLVYLMELQHCGKMSEEAQHDKFLFAKVFVLHLGLERTRYGILLTPPCETTLYYKHSKSTTRS